MDQVDSTAASVATPVRAPITTPPLNISITRELAIAGESEYDESDSVEHHHPLAAANEDLAATTEVAPAAALPHVSFSAGILARRNTSLNEPSPLSPLPSTTTAGQSAAPLPLGGPAFLSRRPTPNFRGRSMKGSPSRARRFFGVGPSPHASPDSKLPTNPGAIDDSEEERRWSSEDDDGDERRGTSNSGSSFWRFFEEGGRWAWFPAIGDSNDRPSTGKGRFALEAFLPQIYHPRWTMSDANAILSTWCLLSSLLAGISASLLSFYNHIDRSVMENNAADPNTVASSGVPALVFHCNFAALTINIYSALLAAVSMVASVTLQTIQREERKKLAKQKKRRRSSETPSSEGHKQQQQDEQPTEEEQPRKRGLLLGNGHRLKAFRSRASSRGNQEQLQQPQQNPVADQEPGIPLAIIGQLPLPSTSAETSSVTNSLPPLPPFERLGSSITAAASSICSTASKSTVASVVASAAAAVGSSRRVSASPSSSSQNTSSTQTNASTTNPTPTATDTTNGGGSSKPSSSSTTSSLPLAHLFLTSVLDELTLLCGFLIPFSAIIELFGLTFFAYTRHHAFEGMTFAIVLMSGSTWWSILRGCWRGREREREEREERECKVEKEDRKKGRDV